MTTEQEEFEKFVRRTNGTWADKCLTRGPNGRYQILQTWSDWIAWQACWLVRDELPQPVPPVQSGGVDIDHLKQCLESAMYMIGTTTKLTGDADRQENWKLVAQHQVEEMSKVLGLLAGLHSNLAHLTTTQSAIDLRSFPANVASDTLDRASKPATTQSAPSVGSVPAVMEINHIVRFTKSDQEDIAQEKLTNNHNWAIAKAIHDLLTSRMEPK